MTFKELFVESSKEDQDEKVATSEKWNFSEDLSKKSGEPVEIDGTIVTIDVFFNNSTVEQAKDWFKKSKIGKEMRKYGYYLPNYAVYEDPRYKIDGRIVASLFRRVKKTKSTWR